VIIVGAGIGGLTTHLVCRRAGFEVAHFERQPHLGTYDAGLVLWPNVVKILRRLCLGDPVSDIGQPIEHMATHTHLGTPVAQMPLRDLERKRGAPAYAVSRSELHAVLAAAVGRENVHLGAWCTRVEADSSAATAHFADGRKATGDVLVGADGNHSLIRSAVVKDRALRYTGMANWGGILPNDGLLAESTGSEFIGDGKHCGLLALTENRLYVTFTGAVENGSPLPRGAWCRKLRDLFAGWPAPIPTLLKKLEYAELRYLAIHDLPSMIDRSRGRLTLLGDAAVATATTFGQGACQAMEDAILLARFLNSTTLGVAESLARYDAKRHARADQTSARSHVKPKAMQVAGACVDQSFYHAFEALSAVESMKAQPQPVGIGLAG
jgi:FAD-dependent urate hydroxylase